PREGVTLNDGDFSSWNGQRPLRLPPPALRSWRYSPITSAMDVRSRTSAMSSLRIRPATSMESTTGPGHPARRTGTGAHRTSRRAPAARCGPPGGSRYDRNPGSGGRTRPEAPRSRTKSLWTTRAVARCDGGSRSGSHQAEPMTDVVLDGVDKVYPGGQVAVRNVRLRINEGELFVLLGPSGCGKSTILRMIAGLEEITAGDLWLNGSVANDLPPRERNVAMVFQEGALYPHRTVRGNMMFPLEVSGDDRAEAGAKVVELARALGINTMIDRLPGTLSGGQRQRAAIGRALIREPQLFLMDEPLSSLDARRRTEMRIAIAGLVRSTGTTTVYVTHDQVEAMTMADRMAVLRDGVLEDVGTPEQIYEDPATVFVAAFLSSP